MTRGCDSRNFALTIAAPCAAQPISTVADGSRNKIPSSSSPPAAAQWTVAMTVRNVCRFGLYSRTFSESQRLPRLTMTSLGMLGESDP